MMNHAPAGVTCEEADAASVLGDRDFWRLYENSFPYTERESPHTIVRSLESGGGIVIRALTGNRTVGLATAQVLLATAATFLVYLAVDPSWRSKHVGHALLDAADAAGTTRLASFGKASRGLIWEIDDPDAEVAEGERAVRRGRLRFFEKLGGQLLDLPYVQPPVDGRTLVPMRLMFRAASSPSVVNVAEANAFTRSIFLEKYHVINQIPLATLEGLLVQLNAGP